MAPVKVIPDFKKLYLRKINILHFIHPPDKAAVC
jgi:hypothetical protein